MPSFLLLSGPAIIKHLSLYIKIVLTKQVFQVYLNLRYETYCCEIVRLSDLIFLRNHYHHLVNEAVAISLHPD